MTSSRVSVLTISQLTSSDSGVYTCRLSGTDQSGDFNLTVLGKWSFGVCEVLCTRIAHRYMANFKMSIYSFHYWNKNVHNCAVAGGEGRGGGRSGDMSLPCTQAVVLRSHVVRNV